MLSIRQNPKLNKESQKTFPSPSLSDLFHLANLIRRKNLDVKGKEHVNNDAGKLCLDYSATQAAWKRHHEYLLNLGFHHTPSQKFTIWKAGPKHPIWAGDQGHQADEMWQGCWYIPDHNWNAESLWSWRGSADPWSNQECHSFLENPYRMGGEYHCISLEGQGHRPWARKPLRPGYEGSRESAWELPMNDNNWALMKCSLGACLDTAPRTPYSLYVSYKKMSMPSTRHCSCFLLMWKRHWKKNMFENARSWMHVDCNLSEEVSVKVGIHQGSCLNHLLFIMVLEALSQEFCT